MDIFGEVWNNYLDEISAFWEKNITDDDVVLIAGKGHEDYQEINGVKHHFSDSEVVREAFNERRVQMLRAVEGV